MATNKQRAVKLWKNLGLSVHRVQELFIVEKELSAVEEFAHTADVPARLAQHLLDLTADAEAPTPCAHGLGRAKAYDIRVTQRDLAAAVYTSRSYVSIVIGGWVSLGTIAVMGRILCIRDVKALRAIAAVRKQLATESSPGK